MPYSPADYWVFIASCIFTEKNEEQNRTLQKPDYCEDEIDHTLCSDCPYCEAEFVENAVVLIEDAA